MSSTDKKPYGPPNLKPMYYIEIKVSTPVLAPAKGPFGTTAMIQILEGTFQGYEGFEDFHGEIIAPSYDNTKVHADGSGVTLNPTFVMKLHDGNCFLQTLKGKSERDPDNPANSRIHSAAWYEISDERYKWMNNQVFMGYGRKEGNNIHIDYYQVMD